MITRRVLRIAAYLSAGVVATLFLLWLLLQSPAGHSLAVAAIEAATASADQKIAIENLTGWLPGSPRIAKVTISDSAGPWLVLHDVSVDLHILPFIWGETIADEISARQVDWLRQPARSGKIDAQPSGAIPALAVDKVRIDVLNVLARVGQKPGRFSFSGQIDLIDPARKLIVSAHLRELDGGAKFVADFRYAPAEALLIANVDVQDRAGGSIASLAGLPVDASLLVQLASSGPLDDWHATLSARGGSALQASGTASIQREGSWRKALVRLDAQASAYGSNLWRGLVEGHTQFELAGGMSDAGAVKVESLKLISPVLQLSGRGTTSNAAHRAEGLASFTLADSKRLSSLLGDRVSWRGLNATARLSGTWPKPRVEIDAVADGFVADVIRADRATLKATADASSLSAFTNINIGMQAGSIAAGFRGDLNSGLLKGDVSVLATNLAQVGLGGGSLALHSAIDIDQTANTWTATGTGLVRDIVSSDASINGLLQGKNELAFDLGGEGSDLVRVSTVVLTGGHIGLKANGELSAGKLTLDADVVVPDMAALGTDMSGRTDVTLKVTGPLNALQANGSARFAGGKLFGLPSKSLAVTVSEPDGKGLSQLSLAGDLAGRTLTAFANVSWADRSSIRFDNAKLSAGSVSLTGDVSVSRDGMAAGTLAFIAGDLRDIAPLIDLDIAGPASGKFKLHAAVRQQADVQLTSQLLRIDTTRFNGVAIAGKLLDPFSTIALELRAQASTADFDGFVLNRVDATAEGGLRALNIAAKGLRDTTNAAAQGRLNVSVHPTLIGLNGLSFVRDGKQARLSAPVTLSIADGAVSIPPARIDTGGGHVTVSGSAGREMHLSLAAERLPLWVIDFAGSPLPVAGLATGTIVLNGRAHDRSSRFDLKFVNLSSSAAREVARNLVLAATGTTDRNGVTFNSTLSDPHGTTLRTSGRVPFDATGTLSVDAQGEADLSIANVYLGATGERARGRLALAAKVSGTLASPRIAGSGTVKDGFFRSAQAGLELRGISAQFEGSERRIKLSSLSATSPNGGSIKGHGEISLDRTANYPIDLTVTASNAQLIASELTTVTAALDLRMTGSALRNPVVRGKANIGRWDIRVPERLSRPLTPIAVVHRNAPAGFSAGTETSPSSVDTAFSFGLDLAVQAPSRVFARGQGIDAEFGGDARISGTIDDPVVRGRFDLRRGSISLLNERVSLTRGTVTFAGDIEPVLDISGSVHKNSITATISAKGKASDPQIVLSSSPVMPQDEILAHLLFSKGTQQLTAIEAAGLAQAIGKWSGLSTGPDILDRLRTMLGIDALSAVTDDSGATAVSAGSYVGSGVFVGLTQGATNTSGGATVEVDITENIKARGEAQANGNTRVGIAAEWEY